MSSSRCVFHFADGDWLWNFNVKSLCFSFDKIFMRLVNAQYRCICIFAYTYQSYCFATAASKIVNLHRVSPLFVKLELFADEVCDVIVERAETNTRKCPSNTVLINFFWRELGQTIIFDEKEIFAPQPNQALEPRT